MAKKGNTPWNKGLTKETDDRVKKNADNRKGKGGWSSKLRHKNRRDALGISLDSATWKMPCKFHDCNELIIYTSYDSYSGYVNRFAPSYNQSTIPYIEDILNIKYDTIFRHAAQFQGEYSIVDPESNRLYFADAYCERQNIWIEFDEPDKFFKGELKQVHIDRENRIVDLLDCMFLRIQTKNLIKQQK